MKIKGKSKKKTVLLILLAIVLIFGIYAGIDQLLFQTKKDEIISTTKQYTAALVSADSINKDDYSHGINWIVENQKQKISGLLEKYSFDTNGEAIIPIYANSLQTGLNSGWKWYDKTLDDIQVLSANKYPFDNKAYITISYHTAIHCEAGGAVCYGGGGGRQTLEKKNDHFDTYYKVEYALEYNNGWKVSLKNNSRSN